MTKKAKATNKGGPFAFLYFMVEIYEYRNLFVINAV